MPRFPFAWVVWLSLTATSVNVVSAFLPDPSPLARKATSLFTQVMSDDSPLGEDVAVPGKGERNFSEIEGQSKHVLAVLPTREFVSPVARRENLRHAAPTPVFLPVRLWFPRKLSPPPAQDDPFLS
ncbi:MAG TPA: hypothetical protein VKJ47_03860 [Candidatus Binatia bacterium]|nr:hypothetical protein [Candidatus Binatia bacterium]